MKVEEARSLFAYDSWANRSMLDAAARLSDDARRRDLQTSHRSIFETLVHLVAAEEIWLSRWKGAPRPKLTGVDEVPTFDALREWWGRIQKERDAFVAGLREEDLEREIEMSTTGGTAYRHRFSDMFRHLANHSTYHRGQVAAMLRQLGEKPPSTDLIRFYRESPV
jgi:uncharacterized damage-inducible protein DinB